MQSEMQMQFETQDAIRDAKTSDLRRLHTTKTSDQHMILRDFYE